jgi:hypothetical protein
LVVLAAACGGQRGTYSISGTIFAPVSSHVTVNLTGDATASTVMTAEGTFVFNGLASGSYVVTPALPGYLFDPPERRVVLNAANPGLLQLFAAHASPVQLGGAIQGATTSGVSITMTTGATTRSTTSDSSGNFSFGLVPDGTYTLSASAPGWSFVPSTSTVTIRGNDAGVVFVATPPSSRGVVRIAGDAASGVAAGAYPTEDAQIPNPDVLVYDPPNDLWTFSLRFDTGAASGLGGGVSIHGRPTVSTYDETSAGLLNTFGGDPCWSVVPATPPGQEIEVEFWSAAHFKLTLDSVGPPVATNLPASNGNFTQVFYAVHGSFHADCPPLPGSPAQGVVTLDATF